MGGVGSLWQGGLNLTLLAAQLQEFLAPRVGPALR